MICREPKWVRDAEMFQQFVINASSPLNQGQAYCCPKLILLYRLSLSRCSSLFKYLFILWHLVFTFYCFHYFFFRLFSPRTGRGISDKCLFPLQSGDCEKSREIRYIRKNKAECLLPEGHSIRRQPTTIFHSGGAFKFTPSWHPFPFSPAPAGYQATILS